jgi:uncharacterized cupredoxin-like copper-binding protein
MRKTSIVALACSAIAVLVAVPTALAQRSAATATTVTVTEGKPSEFSIVLSAKSVKGGIITFKVTNKGALTHDFRLCSGRNKPLANSCSGRTTKSLSPGSSDTLRVTNVLAGTYEYLCTVPGHAAAGMKGLLKVT